MTDVPEEKGFHQIHEELDRRIIELMPNGLLDKKCLNCVALLNLCRLLEELVRLEAQTADLRERQLHAIFDKLEAQNGEPTWPEE